ncbi:Polynucleotide 5'-hydroxyl-kinase grc3 [Coemansia thaxteri]|uniref:Polynucleotide 5'-hydroxyl-kinase GRC3 n=1 Tax=Coemansia thaxteri TaxID=2663907 RepID=A0A9W8BC32_9FUNG|nr:Polynucleotide 5'-hydroxyl-kinase grc3 [Coemansia thaxteri]
MPHIGTAAPPYRNLFALKHFSERKEMGLPKKPAKRMLALSRLMEASRIKSAAGEQESRDMPLTDADSDKPPADDDAMESDSSVDEFSTAVEYMRREALLAEVIGVANFYPVSHLTSDLQLLQVPQDWVEPLNLASSSALQLDDSFEPTPPVYVIAGPQGQGKSTFSRLLINRLVARYGCVFYMETDVGQSELAPPGALSLSMLTDPLLGPPFTHSGHLEAYHASYLGATTPKHSPDHYVAAIKRLAALYREHVSTARMQRALATKDGTKPAYASSAADLDRLVTPLVVNTQGWLKGLGLDLHYSLCEAVRPTNYIQLYDSTSGPDRPEGETSNWSSVNGLVPIIDFSGIEDCSPQLVWISAMGYERATLMLNCQPASMPGHSTNDSEPSCESTPGDIFPLAAFASTEIANRKGNKLAAHDMRTLSLISQLYLIGGDVQAQAWNASLQQLANPQWSLQAPLASQRPLAVPLTDLIFWLGEEDVPPSQLPRVLNGSIVGVVAISTAPSLDSHIWTETEIRGLYSADNGISDQAAVELSEPGSRVLLRAGLNERCPARQRGQVGDLRIPHIVQGQPNLNSTTFLAHALVRSVDLAEGCLHLLLPPSVACLASASLGNSTRAVRLSPLSRIVGLVKGPGPNMAGVELPVWAMVDGGYAERAMGSSSTKRQGRFNRHRASGIRGSSGGDGESVAPLGIQEAPYLSVEADGGIGASSTRSKGGMQRRALQ